MESDYLQQDLSKELMQHIKNRLPYVLSNLEKKKDDIGEQLEVLGYKNDGKMNRMGLLYKVIGLFIRDVVASLEGNTMDVAADSPQAGYEINKTLQGEIYSMLDSVEREPIDDIISYALVNLSGYHGGIFPHQLAFNISVKQIVEKYQAPVKHGVDMIKNILLGCVNECAIKHAENFPKLRNRILTILREVIEKNVKLTVEQVVYYLRAHQAFINIKHPDFVEAITPFKQDIRFVPNGTVPLPRNDYAANDTSEYDTRSSFYIEPNDTKKGSSYNNEKSKTIELKMSRVESTKSNKKVV